MKLRSVACMLTLVVVSLLLAGCERQPEPLLDDLLQAEGLDEFQRYAGQARELEEEGIPVLMAVLEDSLATPYSVFSYGKTNTCLAHLHELASQGIHSVEQVPVLLRTIDSQIQIADTLVTAEILEMVSGVDVGYDEAFVSSYQPSDEPRRQEMIAKWHHWYESVSN